jgi:hypothetical protein
MAKGGETRQVRFGFVARRHRMTAVEEIGNVDIGAAELGDDVGRAGAAAEFELLRGDLVLVRRQRDVVGDLILTGELIAIERLQIGDGAFGDAALADEGFARIVREFVDEAAAGLRFGDAEAGRCFRALAQDVDAELIQDCREPRACVAGLIAATGRGDGQSGGRGAHQSASRHMHGMSPRNCGKCPAHSIAGRGAPTPGLRRTAVSLR